MEKMLYEQLSQRIAALSLSVGNSPLKDELQKQLDQIRANTLLGRVTLQHQTNNTELSAAEGSEPISSDIKKSDKALSKIQELYIEVTKLRELLHISTGPSIDFANIADANVRKQLTADNMRMEHARLDLARFPDFHEEQVFRRYCVFAFFQVEELLTYYYHTKFLDRIRDLKDDFIRRNVPSKWLEEVRKISDISSAALIIAYNHEFSVGRKSLLDNLRNVRNTEEHRCTILIGHDLEARYNALGLTAKREEARQKGEKYNVSKEDRDLENAYYLGKFIKSRNFKGVRAELENMYKNITA